MELVSIFFPVVDITDIVPFWRQIGRLKKFWSAPSNRSDVEVKKHIKPLSEGMRN
jgi:hypothetical protein